MPIALAFLFILILCGGGTKLWSQVLSLIAIGGFLLFRPPARSPGGLLDLSIAGLLGLALLGFFPLPEAMRESWWKAAVEDFGIPLPLTLSPQPRLTAEAFVLMLGGVGWFYFVSGSPVRHRARKRLLWFYVLGVSLLGTGVIAGSMMGWKYPFGKEAQVFSYFPNRNQTSNLLVTGGIVAFGLSMEAMRRRSISVFPGLLAVVILFFGLIYSLSRAGILLFFTGCVIWLMLYQKPARIARVSGIALSCLIIVFSIFVFFGGNTLDRVSALFSSPGESATDFRIQLAEDASRLILDQPLSGVGLGNFQDVFPQYRNASANYNRIIHPESDWLWLGAELGLPGIFFAFLGVVGLWHACGTSQSGRERAHHFIIFSALVVFLFHSLVDVPSHRYGTIFSAAFLFGLACEGKGGGRPLWMPPTGWRIAGGLLALIGAVWGAALLFRMPLQSEIVYRRSEAALGTERANIRPKAAERYLEEAVRWTPLNWRTWFNRAQFELLELKNPVPAREDFRRARFLEPVIADLPFQEGFAWIRANPVYALSAWQEALRRESFNRVELYRDILDRTSHLKSYAEGVRALSHIDPELRFYYLERLKGKAFSAEIRATLEEDPLLRRFKEEEQSALFKDWVGNNDSPGLIRHFDRYPRLKKAHGRVYALALAQTGQFKEACQIMRDSLEEPVSPALFKRENKLRSEREFRVNPENIVAGLALLKAEIEGGNWNRAEQLIKRLTAGERVPAYVYYWQARILFEKAEFEKSWKAWNNYERRN